MTLTLKESFASGASDSMCIYPVASPLFVESWRPKALSSGLFVYPTIEGGLFLLRGRAFAFSEPSLATGKPCFLDACKGPSAPICEVVLGT